jgi:hypothetical protein
MFQQPSGNGMPDLSCSDDQRRLVARTAARLTGFVQANEQTADAESNRDHDPLARSLASCCGFPTDQHPH